MCVGFVLLALFCYKKKKKSFTDRLISWQVINGQSYIFFLQFLALHLYPHNVRNIMYPKWHCMHKELKMMNYLFIPGYLTQTINIIVLLILKYLYSTLFIFRQTTDKTTTQMKLKILRTKILWYVKTVLNYDLWYDLKRMKSWKGFETSESG